MMVVRVRTVESVFVEVNNAFQAIFLRLYPD